MSYKISQGEAPEDIWLEWSSLSIPASEVEN